MPFTDLMENLTQNLIPLFSWIFLRRALYLIEINCKIDFLTKRSFNLTKVLYEVLICRKNCEYSAVQWKKNVRWVYNSMQNACEIKISKSDFASICRRFACHLQMRVSASQILHALILQAFDIELCIGPKVLSIQLFWLLKIH